MAAKQEILLMANKMDQLRTRTAYLSRLYVHDKGSRLCFSECRRIIQV
jgi:hypothetical protein